MSQSHGVCIFCLSRLRVNPRTAGGIGTPAPRLRTPSSSQRSYHSASRFKSEAQAQLARRSDEPAWTASSPNGQRTRSNAPFFAQPAGRQASRSAAGAGLRVHRRGFPDRVFENPPPSGSSSHDASRRGRQSETRTASPFVIRRHVARGFPSDRFTPRESPSDYKTSPQRRTEQSPFDTGYGRTVDLQQLRREGRTVAAEKEHELGRGATHDTRGQRDTVTEQVGKRSSQATETRVWKPMMARPAPSSANASDGKAAPPVERAPSRREIPPDAVSRDLKYWRDDAVTLAPSFGEQEENPSRRAKAERYAASGTSRRTKDRDDEQMELSRRPRSQRQAKTGGRGRQDEEDEDLDVEKEEHRRRRKEERRKERRKALAAEAGSRKEEKKGPQLYLPEFISVANLAAKLKLKAEALTSKMVRLGFKDTSMDHILNAENAGLIAMEYDFDPVIERADDDLHPQPLLEDQTSLPPRPPVVTIMGHVDHGKTTILDYLRSASVAAGEFGGITQHIGAFSVPMSSGKAITFLDTPGHAAFLHMRQRGAVVTDIVVLVVAADDSVKPQTLEAIKHANAAKVPIIVAINKVDKPDADPERVKKDLSANNINVEDYGGDTQAVLTSGKTGAGLKDLEDAILLLSEVQDHRAATDGVVEGWVLESKTTDRGRVATLLVRRGTLKPGVIIVAGEAFARVRTLRNEAGVEVDSVGPGLPAEVDGWRIPPSAGDEVLEAPSEQRAAEVIKFRATKAEQTQLAKDVDAINTARRERDEEQERLKQQQQQQHAKNAVSFSTNDPPSADATTGSTESQPGTDTKLVTVPLIIKADVSGSAEAIVDSLSALGNPEVRPRILRSAEGTISEFDIEHAAAASGHIVAFNLDVSPGVVRLAEQAGVRLLENNVIYRLVDDVKGLLEEKLAPLIRTRVTGEASVAQVFGYKAKKEVLKVAGCKVRNGTLRRNSKVRVLRGEDVLFNGLLTSLKNVKKDVESMAKGTECGVSVEGFEGFEAGDVVQCYEEFEEKRHL